MSEFDEIWTQDLDNAIARAKASGRYHVADYLALKASNDRIRRNSVKWLFDSVIEFVMVFNTHGARIKLEKKDDYRFKFGNSRLTGSLLTLKQGVRCLSFEAGWTQSLDDGVIRGGGIACVKIGHFGFSKLNEEIILIRYEGEYRWFTIADEKNRISFSLKDLRKHFETLLGSN